MDLGVTGAGLPLRPVVHRRSRALLALTLVACAIFLFTDARPNPIQLWDESRIAVNALEMHLRGLSLVTTYNFAPDLWNTKPPLLVWLIDAAMAILGPGELAVRIPSIAASLGTLALVMSFTRRMTGSVWAAAFAAVLLTFSVGFFGEHGARTGDYDALLCFFTTAYLQRLFFTVHRRKPRASDLLLAGGLVAAAVLTKSVAGLVPGFGLAVYLLLNGRWRRPFQTPWYAAAVLAAALPVLGFYLVRESVAPGYLAAVWSNDVSDRFLTALDRHAGPPWYYLEAVGYGLFFSAGPLALLTPLALPGARGKARQGLLFSLCAAAGVLLVVSLSSTKLPQYMAPAYPFLAIACAIAAHAALQRGQAGRLRPLTPLAARALIAATLAGVVVQGAYFRYVLLPERAFFHQALYGELFASLAAQGWSGVSIVDPGVEAVGVPPAYAAQLRFYALMWSGRGFQADAAATPAAAARPVVASCDADTASAMARLGADVGHVPGCRAILRRDAS